MKPFWNAVNRLKGDLGSAIGEAIRVARIDAIRKAKKLFIINR